MCYLRLERAIVPEASKLNMQVSVTTAEAILERLRIRCCLILYCVLASKASEEQGDNVTAVLTLDTSESWMHKHLPFCLTGIHIRGSSALQKARDLRPGGSCACELTGQT